jgi:biopolymer transport protein ExbD
MAPKLASLGHGRHEPGHNAEMNVTPFVDVMLVLLIIFMVSAPLATLAIKVDLPPPIESPFPPKDPTFVSIGRHGAISISGRPTTLRTLGGDLARRFAVAEPHKQTVLIRADQDVPYADFMAVVDTLQEGGFYKVSLISEAVDS